MTTPSSTAVATARLVFDASALRAGTAQAQQSLGTLYGVVRDNWWGIRNVGIAFEAAGGAIARGVATAVRAAADFETGMAKVGRTTFDSTKSVADNAKATAALGEQLRAIALVKPVGISQLTSIAEQAGALGIAQKDVAAFTATVADLTVATELTANDVPKLARVANIFGLTANEYKNLGSDILQVGRAYAATDIEILKATVRFAGVGKEVGLTTAQTVALSALLLSLGPTAEAGSTSLQQIFTKMAKSVNSGGQQLKNFTALTGLTNDQFKVMDKTDPGAVFTKLIEGIAKATGNGGYPAVTKVLVDLGITNSRTIATISALVAGQNNATNSSLHIANALQLSNDAFAKGNTLGDTAARQYGTLNNQLKLLGNSIHDSAISFGNLLLPTVKVLVGVFQDLALGIDKLPGPLKEVLGVVAQVGSGVLLLAGGFLLLGPRIILAADAFGKLVTSLRVAISTSVALSAAQTSLQDASLRQVFTAGLNTKALQAEADARARELVTIKLQNDELLAETGARQALLRQQLENLAANDAEVRSAAASTAGNAEQALALSLSAELHRENAVAAGADAVAQTAEADAARAAAAANIQQGAAAGAARTGVFSLGAALQFMKSPLGIVIGLIVIVVGLLIAFGAKAKAAAEETKAYAKANQEVIDALRKVASGQADAYKQLVAQQLAYSGAIDIAKKYGVTVQELYNIITNDQPAQAQAAIEKLSAAYKGGSGDAGAVLKQLKSMSDQYHSSANASNDLTTAQKSLNISTSDGTDITSAATAKQDAITTALNKRAAAAESLIGAEEALKLSTYNIADAEKAYADALDKVQHKAEDVRTAELTLAQARLEQEKATKDIAVAQQTLAGARAAEQQAVADAVSAVADSQAKYKESLFAVTDAEKALKVLETPATPLALADATNKLANARLALITSTLKVSDAEFNLKYLQQEGASARDILDAQNSLTAAKNANADASVTATKAQTDLNAVVAGATPEELAKAELALAAARKAVTDNAKAEITANNALKTARRDLANNTLYKDAELALVNAQLALLSANTKVSTSTKALNDARSGTLAQEALVKAEQNVTDAYYNQAKALVDLKQFSIEAAGGTYTAQQKAQDLAAALDNLGNHASGPLADQLHHLADLIREGIPADKQVTITANDKLSGGVAIATQKANTSLDEYGKKSDGIWKGIWDTAKSLTKQGLDHIGTFFTQTVPRWWDTIYRDVFAPVGRWFAGIPSSFNTLWSQIDNGLFLPIGRFFTMTIPRWANTVATSVKNAFIAVGKEIVNLLEIPVNVVIDVVNGFIKAINKATEIHVSVLGLFHYDWNGLQIPIIPRLSPLAEGGILTKPTISSGGHFLAGEAGDEVVIPLAKLYALLQPVAAIATQINTTNRVLERVGAQVLATSSQNNSNATVNHTHNHFNVSTTSQADSQTIANDIAWTQLTRV